jgi:hypothetical protein
MKLTITTEKERVITYITIIIQTEEMEIVYIL